MTHRYFAICFHYIPLVAFTKAAVDMLYLKKKRTAGVELISASFQLHSWLAGYLIEVGHSYREIVR